MLGMDPTYFQETLLNLIGQTSQIFFENQQQGNQGQISPEVLRNQM